MKAWAITDRQASMWSVLSMSKTNCGFFRMFTQNLSGRLQREGPRDTHGMSFYVPEEEGQKCRKDDDRKGVVERKAEMCSAISSCLVQTPALIEGQGHTFILKTFFQAGGHGTYSLL